MKKIVFSLTLSTLILLLFSGCAQRELILDASKVENNRENTWAEETNEEENVDISDLDSEISEVNETESIDEESREKIPRIAFPVSEYNQLPRKGKATVKGSIFVTNSDEERIVGKNTRLYLNPVTSYSTQWYNVSYLDGHKMEKADSRLFNYLRFTASDENGKFAFYGVPSGSYFLIGTVKCGLECGYETPKNIRIATRVSVEGNQIVEKNLNRQVD